MRGLDRKVLESGFRHPSAGGDPTPDDAREVCEEPFDEAAWNAFSQSERIDSNDPANSPQSILMISKGLAPGGDTPNLDLLETSFQKRLQFFG